MKWALNGREQTRGLEYSQLKYDNSVDLIRMELAEGKRERAASGEGTGRCRGRRGGGGAEGASGYREFSY